MGKKESNPMPEGLVKPPPPPAPPKKEDVLKRIIAKWLIRTS
jgi:hypothetical protein